jgi:hypothetical protein
MREATQETVSARFDGDTVEVDGGATTFLHRVSGVSAHETDLAD